MYKTWPMGTIPTELARPELSQLKEMGYVWNDPYDLVDQFEKKVAEFAGSKYAVAVDCCSHGLFLSLKYLQATGTVNIPKNTYASVPMQIIHAGCSVNLTDEQWTAHYQLSPYPIWDAAAEWKKGMYVGGLFVISFQIKKRISIGRGGMIITDDYDAYKWLKKARYDGRDLEKSNFDDEYDTIGWHYYMTPEDAARGIIIMDQTDDTPCYLDYTCYGDLSNKKFIKNLNEKSLYMR